MFKKIYCQSLLSFLFLVPLFTMGQGEPVIIGQKFVIQSDSLNQERAFQISLPRYYNEGKENYPVLYLLDATENFRHTSACVNFLALNRRIPEMIVVGISNDEDRIKDLTPPTETEMTNFPSAGGADQFLNFVEKELIPHIDQNYRTNDYKILVGHSFGGLFTIHTLINRAHIFNSYIAISPSLWWDKQKLISEQSSILVQQPEKFVGHFYMTMGNEDKEMLGSAWKLAGLIEENGPDQLIWKFKRLEDETHLSVPYLSTYWGLEFIFKEWNISNRGDLIAAGGIDAVNAYEEMIQSLYGFPARWEEMTLSGLGQLLLDQGQAEKALPILNKCVELFPQSDRVWFQHGSALSLIGQVESAVKSLKKSLLLNPNNTQASDLIKKLEE